MDFKLESGEHKLPELQACPDSAQLAEAALAYPDSAQSTKTVLLRLLWSVQAGVHLQVLLAQILHSLG